MSNRQLPNAGPSAEPGKGAFRIDEAMRAEWREPALSRLTKRTATAALALLFVVVLQAVARDARWMAWTSVPGLLLLLAFLRASSATGTGYRVRVLSLSTALGLIALQGVWLVGPSPGSLIVLVGALTLLAAYISPKACFRAGFAALVGVALIAVLQSFGILHRPPSLLLDPSDGLSWLRVLVSCSFAGWFVLYTVTSIVRELESAIAERERAKALMLEEQAEKSRALEAQVAATEAMIAAQKRDAYARLAAGVAHDFNNQLMVVLGWTDLLKVESASPERRRDALAAIEDACRHMSSLSRELLTLSRSTASESGRSDPDVVLARQAKSLRRLLPPNIGIELDLDAGREIALGESRLEQIALNLVLNARDAMPNGGSIVLRTRSERERDHDVVVITVSDTGVGIPEEVRAKLFQPLFTTKGDRGTGLGLLSVLRLVERVGGRVDVESEEGRGTTMRIVLPALPLEAKQPARASEPARDAVGRTVLLVERDEPVREVLSSVLESVGCRVLSLPSVELAQECMRRHRSAIDVCCVDAALPTARVEALLGEYRAHFPEGVRVLMTSGNEPQRTAEADEVRVIAKPFGVQDFLRCVAMAAPHGAQLHA